MRYVLFLALLKIVCFRDTLKVQNTAVSICRFGRIIQIPQ